MTSTQNIEPLSVRFEGRPRSWARTTSFNGKRLTPKALRQYKNAVTVAMRKAVAGRKDWPSESTTQRFSIWVVFFLPDRRRCDLDNLVKAVMDAGNKCLWHDDAQIDQIRCEKLHGQKAFVGFNLSVHMMKNYDVKPRKAKCSND